jgi:hypothetical protein
MPASADAASAIDSEMPWRYTLASANGLNHEYLLKVQFDRVNLCCGKLAADPSRKGRPHVSCEGATGG